MTNNDRILSLLGFKPPINSVEGALLDIGIDPTATYIISNSVPLKTVAIQIMEVLLTTANTSTGGGPDYSITYDRNAVLARIKLLKAEIGVVDDSIPLITGKSVW